MNNIEELREHCEEMIAISPLKYAYIPASSIITLIDRIEAAEAALSAANEKLSKPVVLSSSTVMSRGCAVRAIEAAGFKVEGELTVLEAQDKHILHLSRSLAEKDREIEIYEKMVSTANEPWRSFVTNDDISALNRFAECCDDPESGGHDLDKDQVERLVSIGALRKTKRNYHETTDFGDFVISAGFTVEGE
ncbi:TPA: hypothetical protein ACOEXB_002617 [Yersinia enterocolitica]